MRKKDLEKMILQTSQDIADNQGIKVCEVEYAKEGGYNYLRIYIDKEDGVSLDDCQGLSRELSKKLDEVDPIEENYFLEVSSLGLDRPLKTIEDVANAIGTMVDVSFYKKINGAKKYTGEILDVEEKLIKLKITEEDTLEFDFDEASKIKLSVEL
ncbi:MAG: ribosome maturation factor RimP [Tissierellales bacterium]|jgi:ribosome maturation factor RimP|nr:ribosome maturation factor RimP [Tissierellales bacterium]